MLQISAETFRQKLAGLESPEKHFSEEELADLHAGAVDLIKSLHGVYGATLDRKAVWERISNGIPVAAAKSGGRGEKFLAEMLDYVKAEAGMVASSDALKKATVFLLAASPEAQRQFIRICVEYRMLLCLKARESVIEARESKKEIFA